MKLSHGMGFICGIRESVSANGQEHQQARLHMMLGPAKPRVNFEIQEEPNWRWMNKVCISALCGSSVITSPSEAHWWMFLERWKAVLSHCICVSPSCGSAVPWLGGSWGTAVCVCWGGVPVVECKDLVLLRGLLLSDEWKGLSFPKSCFRHIPCWYTAFRSYLLLYSPAI